MNERIKELSIKAGFPDWSNHAIEFELEQFAELIVRDCIQTLVDHGYTDAATCLQEERFGKEHFGVE